MIQSKETQTDPQPQVKDCGEKDPTQKSINAERDKYCDQLYVAAGDVEKWQASFNGYKELYKEKKCLFTDTEKNYRILRNFNITIGSEFMQTNETFKENIVNYLAKNTKLSDTLKSISSELGALKSKMKNLYDQAHNLESCRDAQCNSAQWEVLTGKQPAKSDPGQSKSEYQDKCADSEEFFNKLICIPLSLFKDVESIFNSSADVRGIHVFSNLTPLEPLRLILSDLAQKLNTHMQDSMKLRETDLKKIQEEFISIIKESAKSNVSRYNARSNFEGNKEALNIMCCLKEYCKEYIKDVHCDPNNVNEKVQRLEKGEEKICELCVEVKKIYCPENEEEKNSQRQQGEQNQLENI